MKKFIHRDDVGDFECPTIQIIDGKRAFFSDSDIIKNHTYEN